MAHQRPEEEARARLRAQVTGAAAAASWRKPGQ
jgi:hypothetical protein